VVRRVFLDACVLVPITLTNVILTAAEVGIVKPFWSPAVVEEAIEALAEIYPGEPSRVFERRFAQMANAFPGSLVAGEASSLDGLQLPDPDDAHVIAAAIVADAEAIVTDDANGFPEQALVQLGLDVVTPGQLLNLLLDDDDAAMVGALRTAIKGFQRPPVGLDELLDFLERCWPSDFSARVRALT